MRISDLMSDVCSSDLRTRLDITSLATTIFGSPSTRPHMLPEASRMNSRLLLAGVSVFATSSPLSEAMAAPGAPARSNSVHNNVSNLFMARLPRLRARYRMRLEAERVGDLFQRGHVLFRIATGDQRPIARGRPTDLVFQTERAAHPGHPALVHRIASHRVLPFAGDKLVVMDLVR